MKTLTLTKDEVAILYELKLALNQYDKEIEQCGECSVIEEKLGNFLGTRAIAIKKLVELNPYKK